MTPETTLRGRGHTAALEAEVAKLRRERDALRLACQMLITDGADAGSRRCKASHVAALVEDLRRQENHVVAAMGISDGHTDFHKVFRAMGIPDAWILTPGNTASEIRKAFRVFAQSAIAATGGAAVTALGGFAN